MHVLVLKLVTVYSSYGLSNFVSKCLNLRNFDQSQIFDLNTPSDRPYQELLNACFSFEIGQSKLKLWPLQV